ncbi:MAG: hypothetical protein FWE75_18580 [Actinomycetia bacterium]|nr:hypothetical protein [Actinomycetes bacterium]
MARLVASAVVTPRWNQIEVQDLESQDTPEWETGDEKVVAGPGCLLIGTIDDTDGTVTVDLRVGPVDVPGVTVVHEGLLSCPSGIVSVNSPCTSRKPTLRLPRAGDWRVTVAVSGAGLPDYVGVFFREEEWDAGSGAAG